MIIQVNKLVINILLVALFVVPLNGLMAMTNVNLSETHKHVANIMSSDEHQVLAEYKTVCDHCKKNSCHEKHQCSSGQCFSSPVIILTGNTGCAPDLTQLDSIEYRVGLIIPPLYAFFRPPR